MRQDAVEMIRDSSPASAGLQCKGRPRAL